MRSSLASFLVLLPALPLTAQKMPLPDDPQRVVAVYPMAGVLDRCLEHRGDIVQGFRAKPEVVRAHCRAGLLHAIRTFAQPPLGAAEHVAELGPDRLVALVQPQQAAWIDRFFERLARTDLSVRLDGHFDRIRLPVAKAAEILARPDLPERIALPVNKEQVRALRRGGDKVGGPTSWRFPHGTWMSWGSGLPFVKNWRRVPSLAQDIVAPELGKAFDGVEFELQYVPLPDGGIGWAMRAEVAIVDRDTPTRTVRIDERDYVIDEPAIRAATLDAALTMDGPAPFVFGQRLGDDVMLLLFTPK